MKPAESILHRLTGGHWDGALEGAQDTVDLSTGRIQDSIDRLAQAAHDAALPEGERRQVLGDAETALIKLAHKRGDAELLQPERAGLEAIVVTDGSRPSVLIKNGKIDTSPASHGVWHGKLEVVRPQLESTLGSIGRINVGAERRLEGTGFVIGDGLIATNRHVLQKVAIRNGNSWEFKPGAHIDFLHEQGSDERKAYALDEVAYFSPDDIALEIDFADLDLAVLRTQTDGDFPRKIALSAEPSDIERDAFGETPAVCVIGYPAEPPTGNQDVLDRLFRNQFGFKRWAPGYLTLQPGEIANNPQQWVFAHDATTLGGNSGSCILKLSGTGRLCVGLHFSGNYRNNYAHAIAAIRSKMELG